jgi:hypothetical protein
VLASVKNFLADNWDRNQAARRGGGYQLISLDLPPENIVKSL